MKLKQLILENYRGFRSLELDLDTQLTVLVGANGAGKSSILDAMAILLSWAVARVRRVGSSGRSINELDIRNQAHHAVIRLEAHGHSSFFWQLVKGKAGYGAAASVTMLDQLSDYARTVQQRIAETDAHCSIPVLAYYPVNRAVLDIPLRIRTSHEFGLLDAWDESLVSASNFRSFFEWFRGREDLENEEASNRVDEKYQEELMEWAMLGALIPSGQEGRKPPPRPSYQDAQLKAVREALTAFLPEFEGFAVKRSPLRMVVNKQGQEVRVEQLSDGEKCLIALVADLARRLAIANPVLPNPLQGEGVVLIDEIDLHLHPGWQRMVLPGLLSTFPHCQFVVSTHSPQALGEVDAGRVRMLVQREQGIDYVIPQQAKGLTSNEVLDELMAIPGNNELLSQNAGVKHQLDSLFQLIDEGQFEQAKTEIDRITRELHGSIPDIVRAEALISMLDGELGEDEAA